MIILTFIFAATFAAVHLSIDKLRVANALPRSRWLSVAGGVAVAYVFLHILPELSSHQGTFARGLGLSDRAAERWVYLTALAGLAIFYGLERTAKLSRKRSRSKTGRDVVEAEVFWLHIGSFALYNVLIGYLLLHREETGLTSLIVYFVAMTLHFVTNDFGLREDHRDRMTAWVAGALPSLSWQVGRLAR